MPGVFVCGGMRICFVNISREDEVFRCTGLHNLDNEVFLLNH